VIVPGEDVDIQEETDYLAVTRSKSAIYGLEQEIGEEKRERKRSFWEKLLNI